MSLGATVASAEWVLLENNESGDRFYVDPASKRRTGTVVRIWVAVNYSSPKVWNGKAYYSSRIYYQYDCAERTSQGLQVSGFAGKMLTGDVIGSDTQPGNKSFIAPDTAGQTLFHFACQ